MNIRYTIDTYKHWLKNLILVLYIERVGRKENTMGHEFDQDIISYRGYSIKRICGCKTHRPWCIVSNSGILKTVYGNKRTFGEIDTACKAIDKLKESNKTLFPYT